MPDITVKVALHAAIVWMTLIGYASLHQCQFVRCTEEDPSSGCSVTYVTGKVTVDCSEAKLSDVPIRIPYNVSDLILTGSHLMALPPYAFCNCTDLVSVDLSRNNLTQLKNSTFAGLSALEFLFLNNNQLKLTDTTSIPTAVFSGLYRLRVMYLHNNHWQNDSEYREDIFAHLGGLETLSLDGNSNISAVFGDGFGEMAALKELHILGGLLYVGNNTLSGFSKCPLERLYLSSGRLTDLDVMSFEHFSRLSLLSLSNNPPLGFNNASKAWYGLQFTSIKALFLERAVRFETEVNVLSESFFMHLNKTRITTLVLNGNNIVAMDAVFSLYLPYLEYLSFAYNRLVQIANLISDISRLEHLLYLNANYQSKRQFISEEELTFRVSPVESRTKRQTPDMGSPDVGPIPKDSTKPIEWKLPPKLRQLNVSETLNIEWVTLPKVIFYGPSELVYLDYSGNGLRQWDGPFEFRNASVRQLTVDISRNQAYSIDNTLWGNDSESANQTVRLILRENRLGPRFADDSDGSIFIHLTQLEMIDIAENNIKVLPTNMFHRQTKMRELLIDNNALSSFDLKIDHMENLSYIGLSHNLLRTLPENIRQELNKRGEKVTLDLTENPLDCTCDNLGFMKWTKSHKSQFDNYNSYQCTFNGKFFTFEKIDDMISELEIECSLLTIILSVTLPVVVIAALSLLAYRHRWEIRFWFLVKFIKMKQSHAYKTQFLYDAFVSFQEDDLRFVTQKMIPGLEECPDDDGENLKLNIHHRDFEPGATIMDNIHNAIYNSKKMLVVLSKNFVKSKWTYLELQMACIKALDDMRSVVIVIMLEEVPKEQLTEPMLQLLHNNTYIKWSENPADEEAFWRRLRAAIRKDVIRPIRCPNCAQLPYKRRQRITSNAHIAPESFDEINL